MSPTTRLRPEPQDHDLDVLLATPLHRYLGLRPADPDDPSSGLVLDVREELTNNSRMLHGGLVSTCIDVAAAYAIFPTLYDDEVVLTSSLAISYLRPVPVGSQVLARAEVHRRGRATAFLESRVTLDDKVIAIGQVVKAIVTLDGR
jgi:uncharacterized protein (TIGR00369 family)